MIFLVPLQMIAEGEDINKYNLAPDRKFNTNSHNISLTVSFFFSKVKTKFKLVKRLKSLLR